MQKRLISMVLALSMALSAMPLPALAQSAPPDTAGTAALAEENDDVTDIFPDDWSGKPAGDPFGGGKGSWSYDKDTLIRSSWKKVPSASVITAMTATIIASNGT